MQFHIVTRGSYILRRGSGFSKKKKKIGDLEKSLNLPVCLNGISLSETKRFLPDSLLN